MNEIIRATHIYGNDQPNLARWEEQHNRKLFWRSFKTNPDAVTLAQWSLEDTHERADFEYCKRLDEELAAKRKAAPEVESNELIIRSEVRVRK